MEKFLSILQEFGLTFVPLFVAMDAIGILPILMPLTLEMNNRERRRVILFAIITALGLGLAFLFIGNALFTFMGIRVADFLVAGGFILFLLAAKDLITGKMFDARDVAETEMIGVVPLGTPLIVGPAVLTTLLVLIQQFSIIIVIVAFIINLSIAWLLFKYSHRIMAFLGQGGIRATSKVVALFLAAIAVKMIRQGIVEILEYL